jgi:hypothetical protein
MFATPEYPSSKIQFSSLFDENPELDLKIHILENFETSVLQNPSQIEFYTILSYEFPLIILKLGLESDEKTSNLTESILEEKSTLKAKKLFVALVQQYKIKLNKSYQLNNIQIGEKLDLPQNHKVDKQYEISSEVKEEINQPKNSNINRIKGILISAFLVVNNLITPYINSFENQRPKNIISTEFGIEKQEPKITFYAESFEEMAQKINESGLVSKTVIIQILDKDITIELDEKPENTTIKSLKEEFLRSHPSPGSDSSQRKVYLPVTDTDKVKEIQKESNIKKMKAEILEEIETFREDLLNLRNEINQKLEQKQNLTPETKKILKEDLEKIVKLESYIVRLEEDLLNFLSIERYMQIKEILDGIRNLIENISKNMKLPYPTKLI